MFDLTWFCSHMFSTSGEHRLLPFLLIFARGGGAGGCQQQCRVWAVTLGGELAACCSDWVQQYLPQVMRAPRCCSLACFPFGGWA